MSSPLSGRASERVERRVIRRLLRARPLAYRFWYVLRKRTIDPDGPLASTPLVCRPATAADVAHLGAFAARRPPEEIAAWLADPDTWLLLAFLGDRLVGYDCVMRKLPSEYPFSQLSLKRNEVWVRDVYTIPELRRQRIRRTLRAHRVRRLRELGYDTYVSAAAEDNLAPLIATYDSTVESVSGLEYRRVLVWRRATLIADVRRRLETLLSSVQRADPASRFMP